MTIKNHAQVPGFNPNLNTYQPPVNNPPERRSDALEWMRNHKGPLMLGGIATSIAMLVGGIKMMGSDNERTAAPPAATATAFPNQNEIPSYLKWDIDGDKKLSDQEFDRIPPAEFANLPDLTRARDVMPKLHRFMPGALNNLQPHLSSAERSVLTIPDMSRSPGQWTDQDYLNYFSIALALVTSQGSQPAQIAEGQRALSVVISPKDSDFESVMDEMERVDMIQNIYKALPSPYAGMELAPGDTVDGVKVGGDGGRIILASFLSDENRPTTSYMFFANISDGEGNVGPMLMDQYDVNDPRIAQVPRHAK